MMVNEKTIHSKNMLWIIGFYAYDALLDVIITVDIFPWLLFGLLNKIFKKLNTLLNK